MARARSTPRLTTTGRDDARAPADAHAAPLRQGYNPIQKDTATFLKTAAKTNGASSLLEIEVAPGGDNGLHYHTTFAEQFTVISGAFGVQVGKEIRRSEAGESAVAPAGTLHRWFNTSQQPATVRVELRPGHTGFERVLQIVYGVACDGLTTKDGRSQRLLAHGPRRRNGGYQGARCFLGDRAAFAHPRAVGTS